jgi:hypothetical protein
LASIGTDTAWDLRTLPAINTIARKRETRIIYLPAEQKITKVRRSRGQNGAMPEGFVWRAKRICDEKAFWACEVTV